MDACGTPAPESGGRDNFPPAGAAGHLILEDGLSMVFPQPLQPALWCQLVPKHRRAQSTNGARVESGMPGCTFGTEHRPGQAEALQTLGTLLHVPAEGNDP